MCDWTYLFVREDGDLVGGTATDGVVIVGVSANTHPVAGEARLDVGEIGQLTVIVLGGIVDVGLQGPFQLQLLCMYVHVNDEVKGKQRQSNQLHRGQLFFP